MKIRKNSKSLIENSDAVTEVVGEILITTIAVLAFSVISIFVFSYLDTTDKPHVDVEGWVDVDSDIINIRHSGGEVVDTKDMKFILNLNGSREEIDVESVYNEPTWRLGDVISINTSSKWNQDIKDNQYIESTIVHTKSNVVIENGILLSEEYNDSGIGEPTFSPGDNQSDYVEYVDGSVDTEDIERGENEGSGKPIYKFSFEFNVTNPYDSGYVNITNVTIISSSGNSINKVDVEIDNKNLPAVVSGNNIPIEIKTYGRHIDNQEYEYIKNENNFDISVTFFFNDESEKTSYFQEN